MSHSIAHSGFALAITDGRAHLCVCVFSTLKVPGYREHVLDRDSTRHPTRPTTTAPASPVLGFTGLNIAVLR